MKREFTYDRSGIWVICSQYLGKFGGANTELGVERGKCQARPSHLAPRTLAQSKPQILIPVGLRAPLPAFPVRPSLQPLGQGWPAWEGACVWGAARRGARPAWYRAAAELISRCGARATRERRLPATARPRLRTPPPPRAAPSLGAETDRHRTTATPTPSRAESSPAPVPFPPGAPPPCFWPRKPRSAGPDLPCVSREVVGLAGSHPAPGSPCPLRASGELGQRLPGRAA